MTATHDTLPRPEYPRPDFVRERWMNLNGTWDFGREHTSDLKTEYAPTFEAYELEITVPFAYQAELSGIGDPTHYDVQWYRRTFVLPEDWDAERTLLHFGAVDYLARVWVDGHYLGEHRGGYTPFTFDITPWVAAEPSATHTLVVRSEDTRSCAQPRGKQNWQDEPHGCWYTPVSGIWQTVWLEGVGRTYIEHMSITPCVDTGTVAIEAQLNQVPEAAQLEYTVTLRDQVVATYRVAVLDTVVQTILNLRQWPRLENFEMWWPHHPTLYDVQVRLVDASQEFDCVQTYFGMRKIEIVGDHVLLNNVPLYQKLILDQGYWPDGLLTAPSDDAYKRDIELTLAMGFNGARKHQKIEDPRYYYWADRLGLLVWGELPSPYDFNQLQTQACYAEMAAFIQRDMNHPCIITWVPLNESWGVRHVFGNRAQQQFADGLYHLCKALDPTRPVSTNDGWEYGETDIVGFHDYTAWESELNPEYADKDTLVSSAPNRERMLFARGYTYHGQPILCTEFGGIAFAADATDGNWGYNGAVADQEAFMDRYRNITEAFRKLDYVRGYCYTQLTDVFHEVNGLLTMDREPKVPIEQIREVNY